MSDDNDKIRQTMLSTLSGVPETALITLAARILAPKQNPDLGFADSAAEQIASRLGFDPGRFSDDRGSMRGSIVRALWFDHVARGFVSECPDGLVISIGSGLDTRANRIAPPAAVRWVDIDFAEMTALREELVPPLPNVRNVAADGTNVAAWANAVDWKDRQPVLVLAEGVSMYLDPASGEAWVRGLVMTARQKASPMTLAVDLASPFMAQVGHRNPSVAKTGASFTWGVGEPKMLSQLAPELHLVETYDVASRSGFFARLVGNIYRLLTGRSIYSCARFQVYLRGEGAGKPPSLRDDRTGS